MLDFATVLRAPIFQFQIGKDGDRFNVPAVLAKDLSQPLHKMMNNGQMKESQSGVAVLEEVESGTFTAFCEYAYTGNYRVPRVAVDSDAAEGGHELPHVGPYGEQSHEATRTGMHDEVPEPASTIEEESLPIPEDSIWGSLGKKPKKKGLKSKRHFSQEADRPAPVDETESDTGYKGRDSLWQDFVNMKPESMLHESPEKTNGTNGVVAEIELKPLLFHSKLCVFAQIYLIKPLRTLALRKLHAALRNFELSRHTSSDVLDVLEYVYTHTERGGDGCGEELRQLVAHYAASKTNVLKKNREFRSLLDVRGELGSDLVFLLA